jgi:Lipocalin-like domain
MIRMAETSAGQVILDGTWRLISSTRTNAATGETVDTIGPNPRGFITYTRDGRLSVLIARDDRPRPGDVRSMSDAERSRLYSTMMAYTGRYKFNGKTIEHDIDIAWNEIWGGTKQIRDVKKEGDRLIYTTRPAPSPADGVMGYGTVIWEKVT